jgi:hypothetical protein
VDLLMQAFQTGMTGRIHVSLVPPPILIDILKNISINLPKGLELVVGTEYSELRWYYENVKANMANIPRGFLLVLALKDVNRLFALHRLYTYPTRITNGTFVHYKVDGAYFAISSLQHAHFSLSET